MRTAHEIVIAAMQRVDADPLIKSLSKGGAGNHAIATRHYYGLRDMYDGKASYTQILDDSQMEDACVRFLQRSAYYHSSANKAPEIGTVYARLMWLCAIENVTCAIYKAAITEESIEHPHCEAAWTTAFNVASVYSAAYDKKLDEWSTTLWSVKSNMRRNSDAISRWVAAREYQSKNSPEHVAVLEAIDSLRNSLLYAADKGRLSQTSIIP